MKALTLTQPWASLVAIGAKQIETRNWGTSYRGPLAIHAAKGFPKEARSLCVTPIFYRALDELRESETDGHVVSRLPLGMIVAVCTLANVKRIAHTKELFAFTPIPPHTDEREFAFGDYTVGRYMWLLTDVRRLASPVPARGALGLWEWAGELEDKT